MVSVTSTGKGGAATYNAEVAAVRLNLDGSLDTTYGGSAAAGIVLFAADANITGSPDPIAVSTAIQPGDGKLLVSTYPDPITYETGATALYRFDVDGTADTTLGTGGQVATAYGGPVVAQADGHILLANSGYAPSVLGSGLLRLDADGSVDQTFGNTVNPGIARGFPDVSAYNGQAVTVQADGKILLAGYGTVPSLSGRLGGLTLARFLPDVSTATAAKLLPPLPPASYAGYYGANLQTNLVLYDPSTAMFEVATVAEAAYPDPIPFGGTGVGNVIPALANYQGLGQDQLAAYLPGAGLYAVRPNVGADQVIKFGIPGAGQTIPVPADYEGTGKDDIAIYMPTIGAFAILPSNGSAGRIVYFGTPGAGQSIPAPADYFGTGQADMAVYLASTGSFAIADPTGKTTGEVVQFGPAGLGKSIPVSGDYDGSGHVELAVYVPSLGAFFYRPYKGGADVEVPFGTANSGQIPVPGDYDGSGRTEVAIYDPAEGFFAYRPASGVNDVVIKFGTANDGSLPAAAPGGALPEFAAPASGSGRSIVVPRSGEATASSSSAAVATTRSAAAAAVPSGPRLATSARVARLPVNQAAPDAKVVS